MKLSVLTLAVLVLPAGISHAQIWDGGGTNDKFTTAANWLGDVLPVNDGLANIFFNGNTRRTPEISVDFSADKINFGAFNTGPFTVGAGGGSSLTIGAGGVSNPSPSSHSFTVPVNFSNNCLVATGTGGHTLDFTGDVDLGTSILTVDGNGDANFDALSGTGGLIMDGTGTLRIDPSGFPTHFYDLTVNGGAVEIGRPVELANVTVAVNGGTLDLDSTHLRGATLTRSAGANLTGGFSASRGASVTIDGAINVEPGQTVIIEDFNSTYESGDVLIKDGGTFAVLDRADATINGSLGIGALIGEDGTLLVDGSSANALLNGATFEAAYSLIADKGSATVEISNGANAEFSSFLFFGRSAGSTATLLISNGAEANVTSGNCYLGSSGSCTATITGAGSKITGVRLIAGSGSPSNTSVVDLENGGELVADSTLEIGQYGTLNIDGGILTLNNFNPLENEGTLNFIRGRINLSANLGVVGAGSSLLDDSIVVLGPGREISVADLRTTTVGVPGALVLDGGVFETGRLVNAGGTIDLRRGKLAITGSSTFRIGSTGPLGSNVVIPQGLTIDLLNSRIDQNARLTVDGGTLSVGAENLTNALGGQLDLAGGAGQVIGSGEIRNRGLVSGDGTIATAFTNFLTGRIRADFGETILFTSSFAPNTGEISLQGGSVDVLQPVTNAAEGFITGRGALYTGGLSNDGQMAFSGGNADLHGDVTLNAGSRVVTSGAGSVTTFFDDVVHNGLEIYTGAGASTVIFGNQTGAGPFNGMGTIYYIGDLRPGNSPATVSYGGDVVYGAFTTLGVEIGGATRGTQYDALDVAGTLHLDGTLEVTLTGGYQPLPGTSFQLFDAGNIVGSFSSILLPTLAPGSFWRTDQLHTTGVLSVGVVPATFAEFSAAYQLQQGAGGDDDLDGLSNALELLLGSDPTDSSSAPSPTISIDGTTTTFTITLPEVPATGAHYSIESGTDLVSWSAFATSSIPGVWTGPVSLGSAQDGFVELIAEFQINDARRFFRITGILP